MKITLETPGVEFLLVALNGEVIGYLEEFDTEAGYVLQRQYSYDEGGMQVAGELVRKEGRVDIVGNIMASDSAVMAERASHIREQLRCNWTWSTWSTGLSKTTAAAVPG